MKKYRKGKGFWGAAATALLPVGVNLIKDMLTPRRGRGMRKYGGAMTPTPMGGSWRGFKTLIKRIYRTAKPFIEGFNLPQRAADVMRNLYNRFDSWAMSNGSGMYGGGNSGGRRQRRDLAYCNRNGDWSAYTRSKKASGKGQLKRLKLSKSILKRFTKGKGAVASSISSGPLP